MVFISGPRQIGKTTFAKQLLEQNGYGIYHTWDDLDFRKLWTKTPKLLIPPPKSDEPPAVVVIDEIHKAKQWKNRLKGIFDTLTIPVKIIVTGSARLNVYVKGGDSLMGGYLHFRLHPFTLGELLNNNVTDPDHCLETLRQTPDRLVEEQAHNLNQLLKFGGFPDPLFAAVKHIMRVWQKGRLEKIIREDLRDLSRIMELGAIEMLVALLEERVGSPLSVESLREDLEVSHSTVRRWLNYLTHLYYCYEIKPYSRAVKRSIKNEGKLYLWDWAEVKSPAARYENLLAGHLLKACHFWTDIGKGTFDLHFLRNKEKQEVDFLITKDHQPWLAVEVKSSKRPDASGLIHFSKMLQIPFAVQVYFQTQSNSEANRVSENLRSLHASTFLAHLP